MVAVSLVINSPEASVIGATTYSILVVKTSVTQSFNIDWSLVSAVLQKMFVKYISVWLLRVGTKWTRNEG